MANFEAVTASDGGKLKPGMEEQFDKLIDRFGCGDLTINREGGYVNIYGYDWPDIWNVDDDDREDATDVFFELLAPLLETPLIVQSIGNEKCRFPLSAQECYVYPSGKVAWKSLTSGDVPEEEQDVPPISPRQPFDDSQPDGYLESARDFVARNIDAAVFLLERELRRLK